MSCGAAGVPKLGTARVVGAAAAPGTSRTPPAPGAALPDGAFTVGVGFAGGTITAVVGAVGRRISNCEPLPDAPLGVAPFDGTLPVAGGTSFAPPLGESVTIRNSVGTAPPAGGTVGISAAGCERGVAAADEPVSGVRSWSVVDGAVVAEVPPVALGSALARNAGRGASLRKPFGGN